MSEPKNNLTGGRLKPTKVTSVQQAVTIAAADAANQHRDELPQVCAGHIRVAANKAAKEFDRTHDEASADEPSAKPVKAETAKAKPAKAAETVVTEPVVTEPVTPVVVPVVTETIL